MHECRFTIRWKYIYEGGKEEFDDYLDALQAFCEGGEEEFDDYLDALQAFEERRIDAMYGIGDEHVSIYYQELIDNETNTILKYFNGQDYWLEHVY